MKTQSDNVQAITTALCNRMMRDVVRTGVVNDANMQIAVEVMRAELMSFLSGAEYADERECIKAGTVSEQVVWASMVLGAANKIRALS